METNLVYELGIDPEYINHEMLKVIDFFYPNENPCRILAKMLYALYGERCIEFVALDFNAPKELETLVEYIQSYYTGMESFSDLRDMFEYHCGKSFEIITYFNVIGLTVNYDQDGYSYVAKTNN